MVSANDSVWFKKNFHVQIQTALGRTPFSFDLITANACQKTAYIWQKLRKKPSLTTDRVFELCVGDTIDGSGDRGRKAFPRNKTDLLNMPNGRPRKNGLAMFQIARRSLEGRSGHSVAVVPETKEFRALRNSEGKVIDPLRSQAGASNFRYGAGQTNWWLGSQFAESAFWLHG